jgi:superoxide reductase
MSIYVCGSCGHIEFDSAPESCPVCGAKKFDQNDTVFKDSEEKSKEAAVKHIPAVTVNKECGFIPESACTDVMVRIGETLHPMQENHFIQFIDCYVDQKYVAREYLSPGVNPAACFHLKAEGANVTIVENCNVHGYWMAEESIA